MAQIVAGTLIKTFVPIASELVGNALINTGLDDIVFGVTSAISSEFSWRDYWGAKQLSLVSAVKSAAIVSVAGFAATTVQRGAGSAWRLQKLSHYDKLQKMSRASTASLSIASHVAKDVVRAMAASCISQVASRGMQAVVTEVAGTYAGSLQSRIQAAVSRRWSAVADQARALFDKTKGDASVHGVIDASVREVLDRASREQIFTAIARTSKPEVGIAASGVNEGGWAKLVIAGADVANLGVSVARMATLVEAEVSALARTVRDAKERKTLATAEGPSSQEDFKAFLASKETQFSRGLFDIVNGLLQSSVYSPLISYGARFAAEKVVSRILKPNQVEQLASSNADVEMVLNHEADLNKAFYDEPGRALLPSSLALNRITITTRRQVSCEIKIPKASPCSA